MFGIFCVFLWVFQCFVFLLKTADHHVEPVARFCEREVNLPEGLEHLTLGYEALSLNKKLVFVFFVFCFLYFCVFFGAFLG